MMSQHTLLSLFVIAFAGHVRAQSASSTALEPLASKHFTWPNIPYQVTGDNGGIRGPQFGFNLCNSTTENQQSLCQVSPEFSPLKKANQQDINADFVDAILEQPWGLLHVEFEPDRRYCRRERSA